VEASAAARAHQVVVVLAAVRLGIVVAVLHVPSGLG
jgi:hypothetical protein